MQTLPIKIFSTLLKLTAAIAAIWGVGLCAFDPNAFMGGKNVWLYFTIQSNVWIALIALFGLYMLWGCRKPVMPRWYAVLSLVLAISITLTGMVFCFMLAPLMGDKAFILPNTLTHVVVPLAAVLDFFVCSHQYNLRSRDAWYVILPPLYYLCFASYGYMRQWIFAPGDIHYPYFFLNWGSPAGAFGFSDQLPYMGVMYYVILLLLALLATGRLYIAITHFLHKTR